MIGWRLGHNGKPRVAILGAGPSAWYAKAAAEELGFQTKVFSDRIGNAPLGRTWFRLVPPSVECQINPDPIHTIALGDKTTYMARMNREADAQSAYPQGKTETTMGYDPALVRECLMPDNAPIQIVPQIKDEHIREIAETYRWVFVTFATEESRYYQPARIKYPVLVAEQRFKEPHPNLVVYNGTKNDWWTRYTLMWGIACWEFSNVEYPSVEAVSILPEANLPGMRIEYTPEFGPGTKPWPSDRVPRENIHLIGRWATWDKKCHTHDAYNEVKKLLEEEGKEYDRP